VSPSPGIAAALAALLALAGLSACGGATPRVKVLGAEQRRQRAEGAVLTVFVEVVNPTERDLALSRLEYDLAAERMFARRGQVELSRRIGAGSSAIVEIAVPVARDLSGALDGVPYRLAGRLFALGDHRERYWTVELRGELAATRTAGAQVLRVKLAPDGVAPAR
jgi:hypothetical protein